MKTSKDMKAPKIKPQYLVVSGAFLLFALLFLVSSKKYSEKPVLSEMDARVQLGISYVEGGGAPMVGIKMLKDVLKDDPENKYAIRTLADFSRRSNQYDKAIGRYEDLLSIETNSKERFSIYVELEECFVNTGQFNRALLVHDKMIVEFKSDRATVAMIKERNEYIKDKFINIKKD